MRYNLRYFVANAPPPAIHSSSQNLILPPHPTLHTVLLAIASPWSGWWRTNFKSLHQVDSLLSLGASCRLLHPPYLDSNTLAHSVPCCWNKFHFPFASNAILKVFISLIPRRHTVSHFTQAILLWSLIALDSKHNIACRHQNSRVKVALRHPCW